MAPVAVLIGPMGAGKTSIGRKLARKLGVPFADSDILIAKAHGPIPAIFAEHGEEVFRQHEHRIIAEALRGEGVLSLGGGAVTHPETRRLLAGHPVVFLDVSPRVVAHRVKNSARPLLAGTEDPMIAWQRIFDARRPFYEELASLTVDTSRGPIADIVERIDAWVRTSRHEESTS